MDLGRQLMVAVSVKCKPETVQIIVDRGAIINKTDTLRYCVDINVSPGIFKVIYESYKDDSNLITTDNIFKREKYTQIDSDTGSIIDCDETVFEDMTIYEYIKYMFDLKLEYLKTADTDDIIYINEWVHRCYNLKEYMKICGIKAN